MTTSITTEEHIKKTKQAKRLRKAQTEAEQRLWYHLRAHRFLGLKFKHQKPLGPYVVDFICMEHRLVIEVDGSQHNDQKLESDRLRVCWLEAQGLKVLRFWNNEVLRNTDSSFRENPPGSGSRAALPPTPLPQAGEGSVTRA